MYKIVIVKDAICFMLFFTNVFIQIPFVKPNPYKHQSIQLRLNVFQVLK